MQRSKEKISTLRPFETSTLFILILGFIGTIPVLAQTDFPQGNKEDTISLSIFGHRSVRYVHSNTYPIKRYHAIDFSNWHRSRELWQCTFPFNFIQQSNGHFCYTTANAALVSEFCIKVLRVAGSEYGVAGNARYEVYSAGGRLVLAGFLNNYYVDVSGLAAGVYVLSVGTARPRFVKGGD